MRTILIVTACAALLGVAACGHSPGERALSGGAIGAGGGAVAGETVAASDDTVFLFETGIRTRYYLPRHAVRRDMLVPSDTKTRCPYKGLASYYSVRLGEQTFRDLIWCYPEPTPACAAIADRLCFYDEKVERVTVAPA